MNPSTSAIPPKTETGQDRGDQKPTQFFILLVYGSGGFLTCHRRLFLTEAAARGYIGQFLKEIDPRCLPVQSDNIFIWPVQCPDGCFVIPNKV